MIRKSIPPVTMQQVWQRHGRTRPVSPRSAARPRPGGVSETPQFKPKAYRKPIFMRELIYVPVVHNTADMGSVQQELKKKYIEKYSRQKWEEHNEVVNSMWQGLRQKILELKITFPKLVIYQDGLPVCGRELEIVKQVAEMGSENHKLILELIKKGVRLEGTEDPKLLLEEYNYIRSFSQGAQTAGPNHNRLSAGVEGYMDGLLKKRDAYIARRIDATLKTNEKGLLFMGLSHRVDKELPSDIKVKYLIYRFPFRKGSADINPVVK